ncbi:MAG: hypothetical protein CM15mP71_4580 [Candidatus Poseidoniales archaeon]|nr:MAG: hypothetical protein CM15mP71_4580 [Candidatus Poseidoniales archaeon]
MMLAGVMSTDGAGENFMVTWDELTYTSSDRGRHGCSRPKFIDSTSGGILGQGYVAHTLPFAADFFVRGGDG